MTAPAPARWPFPVAPPPPRPPTTTPESLLAREPPARAFERAAMLPNQNHPLTRAYMVGARSTTQSAYSEALRLIRACETEADQLTIDQCKLAAEVMIERKMP